MLPSLKRVQRENMPDAPAWIDEIITIVNNFFQNIYKILNKGITLQDNVRCEIREIERIAPIQDLAIPTKILPPTGIIMLSITGPEFSDPVVMRAHVTQSNVIVDTITGLTSGSTYKVRILIL